MGKYVATAVLILAAGIVVFKKADGDFSITESKLPKEQMDPNLLIETISRGARVDIDDHLLSGRWTVIEFTAEW